MAQMHPATPPSDTPGGTADHLFEELELELFSWLPKRIRKCPRCGDRDRIQFILFGLPLGRPPASEEDRIILAGCLVPYADSQKPRWRCPTCKISYSARGRIVDFRGEEGDLS